MVHREMYDGHLRQLDAAPIVQGLPLPDDQYLFGEVQMLRVPKGRPAKQSCNTSEKTGKTAGRRSRRPGESNRSSHMPAILTSLADDLR